MEFEITHRTAYRYTHPAEEAYGEARLTPPDLPAQTVFSHRIAIDPETKTSSYVDSYGNRVDFFSLPYRHKRLTITNHAVVRTRKVGLPEENLALTVAETRQIFCGVMPDMFQFLQPTEIVEIGSEALQWAKKYLPGDARLGEALPRLNEAVHESFDYTKGATHMDTTLSSIWKHRKGVCQDFAHVALSIFRTAGLPARYVCGYIETDPPKTADGNAAPPLVGAVATHAWVEVLVPGLVWVALDPTNRQWCNERYVTVSYGRDSRDASPLRGTFKGAGSQRMDVKVVMKRRKEKNED
jgi:transglutaminase-like putative cysteine protease